MSKRIWLFGLVVFILPLIFIFVSGMCGNEIIIQHVNDDVSFYLKGEFLRTLTISVSTSLIAAGIVYLFIDQKLRELLAHNEVITVILRPDKGTDKKCPPMSRKDFCRQEVLGYLGMLGGPERFTLNYTKTAAFGERILEIQKGKGNAELIIECSEEELKQFTPSYKENDDITIILQSDSDSQTKITCPPMPRANFSRAEVLGYIGMFSTVQHFKIKSLRSPYFFEELLEKSKSRGAQEFVIKCSAQEMEQFDASIINTK